MNILTYRQIDRHEHSNKQTDRQTWTIKERSELTSYLSKKGNYFSNYIFNSCFQFYFQLFTLLFNTCTMKQ